MSKKEYGLELNGMSCGACETIIKRIASKNGAEIKFIDALSGKVILWCEEEKLQTIKSEFAEKGFSEKGSDLEGRGNFQRVYKYLASIFAGDEETKVESKLLTYVFGSATTILLGGAILSFISPILLNPLIAILPVSVLVIFGVLLLLFSYYHITCYRKNLSCANGMMVGMTVGMMSGFLFGSLVGATNGMFIGSLVGMIFGIYQGFVMGRPAGIMGSMEGVMAGLMAGTMGAMLSVMMINDNLILFLYILFGLCAVMIGALSYMMHREAGPTPIKELKVNFVDFTLNVILLCAILFFVMTHGPKNGIVI